MKLFRSIAMAFVVVLPAGLSAQTSADLTEVERLRWELAAVRSQLHAALAERDACRVEIIPARGAGVKAELVHLQEAIEKAHPGFTFDVKTGVLTPQSSETERKPVPETKQGWGGMRWGKPRAEQEKPK